MDELAPGLWRWTGVQLDLPVDRVLVSHGEPVLARRRDALRGSLT